jgi:hypothetical protein
MALSMDVVSVVSLVSAAGGPTGTGAVAGVRAVGIVETTAAAASAADDASSSHATLGDSHDDQTFVGQAPEAPPGATPRGASTTRLFITALSQGRPVAASLFIDRKPFGETPRTLTLLAGRRTLRLEANGFKSIERSVNLVAGATLDLKVELKAR